MTLVRGIRRIQEVYTDPLLDLGEAYAQGEGGAQQAFNEDPELDPEGLTGGSEQGQTETGGTGDPGDPGDPQAPPVVYLAREYVWGPGDGPGSGTGIYELLAIFDLERRPWWAVQDAGQDVVALIDAGAITPGGSTGGPGVGNGFGDGSNSAARLVGEFSYTAYGELLTAASHAPHPDPRLGHKGLFLDRLDTGVVDPLTGAEVARHALGAKHTYFMVNRTYDPQLGRFLQRDPNATGLPVIAQQTYGGKAVGNGINPFNFEAHLVDSIAIYAYVMDSPFVHSDPLGLYSWEEFGEDAITSSFSLPGPSDFITGALQALITDYSDNLNWDVEWASDWDYSDDWYSRIDDSWVSFALMRGVYEAFEVGFGDYKVNLLDLVATGTGRPNRSTGTPRVRGGENIHTVKGKQAHKNYRNTLGTGYEFEVSVPGGRVDAIDIKNKIIRELKPDTPSGRALGLKQLQRYIRALKNHPNPEIRGNYTGILDLYRP